jgi:hypothetical protein
VVVVGKPPKAAVISIPAEELAVDVRTRLAGGHDAQAVVWAERGSEAIVHLDSLELALHDGGLTVDIDLETLETGRAALHVILALAASNERPNLVAVTGRRSRGDPVLAARWGRVLEDAVWAAVVAIADERAGDGAPFLAGGDGVLLVHAPERAGAAEST